MINLSKLPVDCSVETLFPEADKLFTGEPLGHARQFVSQGLYIHIPYWGITLDPAEDNIPRCDGTIEHDNYIILTKWLNEPITFRFSKRDII